MADVPEYSIRFQHRALAELRTRLLADLTREHWAVVLGSSSVVGSLVVIKAYEVVYPEPEDYQQQSRTFLRLDKAFVHRTLSRLLSSGRMDTIIDVHTHPFSGTRVGFSAVDDADELTFARFLRKKFDKLTYASIVLSQTQYSARVWLSQGSEIELREASLRTQTMAESLPTSSGKRDGRGQTDGNGAKTLTDAIFQRPSLAIGVDTLRLIAAGQKVTIVGLGGLGSVIAENLLHMGFHDFVLIDPDSLEVSNLSRVVGAYYEDAEAGVAKVDVIARHLRRINPKISVVPLEMEVQDSRAAEHIAGSNWLIVATDNHSSRKAVQLLSLEYFVPLISAGVNISLEADQISDMSGEVITARVGDRLCLFCLGRINFAQVAAETHNDEFVRRELIRRGYVSGGDVQEPAVKTLNAIVASMAVDVLMNQYIGRTRHVPILVYENNATACIYEDVGSLARRRGSCYSCFIGK